MTDLASYIEIELNKRRELYSSSPEYILEHYRTEKQNIESYNGRQLLEMLQNADDASENVVGKERKVLIRLSGNELIIANNGEPFSEDGFRSIIYSNLSSKTMLLNKIGHKGLGFRSILSWSDEVRIASGGAKIRFSETIASDFLKDIYNEHPEVEKFIKEREKEAYPIATLRIPKLYSTSDNEVPASDFDTTISIQLKDDILTDVQTQIFSIINKETLIFLNHIEVIEIDSPERKIIYKRPSQKAAEGTVLVESHNLITNFKEEKTWFVKKRKGVHKTKNYELAIAWNEELDDSENVLFSYFKTDVKFPFPALLHGTFELTSNRKYLENDTEGHNKFLTGELAELLIESSLEMTSIKNAADYRPLTLLNIDFNGIDNVLLSYNFKDLIITKIKSSSLFPNVNGKYFNYKESPVYYDGQIAHLLRSENVNNLMPHCYDSSVLIFLRTLTLYIYPIKTFISITSGRIGKIPNADLAKLYHLLLTYQTYVDNTKSSDFDVKNIPPFLIDTAGSIIPWDTNVFVQPPGNREFTLPGSINIRFINQEVIDSLLLLFPGVTLSALVKKLGVFKVKEYSFTDIIDTLIKHYNKKGNLNNVDVRSLHTYLFQLYKMEAADKEPSPLYTQVPTISIEGSIKRARYSYFGKSYGCELTEKLYAYDKSKLIAATSEFRLGSENLELVKKYFKWLGVVEFPRYTSKVMQLPKTDPYIDHIFRSFKYPLTKWAWPFATFDQFSTWLPYWINITVGEYDEIEKIFLHTKVENIFSWIKQDKQLRETLELNSEVIYGATLSFNKFNSTRTLTKQEIPSFTRWNISRIKFLPVESNSKISSPEKCCLSKTITSEFSPFVERVNISVTSISEKLQLPENVLENYLVLIGVHREIGSFSIATLYELLSSLPVLDKEGKVAKKVYREIISNFSEAKIDLNHPSYKAFVTSGKVFCQKGHEFKYFPVSEAYYLPSKTIGNNVLKLFPLVVIDSKQGPQKIERLFGIKRLKDISFNILGEPVIHTLNDEFQNEIERFKPLVYVLRMTKDIKEEIAHKFKTLKIYLAQELRTDFVHNNVSSAFQLETYEYIQQKRKNHFYISVPLGHSSLDQLRVSDKFCESISEIFSSIIETEELIDFLHDLYSKPELGREPRILSFLQREENTDVVAAKKKLNIVDDARILFWRSFAIASGNAYKFEIRNERELVDFLRKKLRLNNEKFERCISSGMFNELFEISNQEFIYELFVEFGIDFKSFSRHFFGLSFIDYFRNKFQDIKFHYSSEFAFQLYDRLKVQSLIEKAKYFDSIDSYDRINYSNELGYLENIDSAFTALVHNKFSIRLDGVKSDFSIEDTINATIVSLTDRSIDLPDTLKQIKVVQAYLLFNEVEEVVKLIEKHRQSNQNPKPNPNTNQIKVRGATIDYSDYQTLAKRALEGLNIDSIKLKPGYTSPIDNRQGGGGYRGGSKTRNVQFNTKNEEQIGFIAELICYHKLVDKYGASNVNWVSENANRAYPEKFITREAGKGYDLELTENGKVRFIEIKGSSNISEGIHMSKDEMRVALEYPEKYDLLIIENPLGHEPNIKHIRMPFKFKREESLFSNEKLSVFNENYVIKFKWE